MKIYMNKVKTGYILPLLGWMAFVGVARAEKTVDVFGTSSVAKAMIATTGNYDGNRVYTDLENNGMIVSHRITGHSGMEWPKGTSLYSVFASGVWYAGSVGGDLRCATAEYGPEMVAGPYGTNSSDASYKIWKVNKSDLGDPLASDDFQNWPVADGAPWVDVDGDGVYTPLPNGVDHPEFLGDQVIWYVRNDGDPTAHTIFQTLPLGIEVQTTVFGFDRPDAFGDMMFVKELIINKGGNTIDDMYIGLWSDPDLGDASDDYVGCDTTLGLGFCWNDGDDSYYSSYSGGTPAVGYDFFQGPIVPSAGDTAFAFGRNIADYKNLSMSSFSKYINGDPVYTDPNDVQEVYNYMQGLMRDGSEFPVAATGGSKFVHPGNPSDDTGPTDDVLVDSDLNPADDRRFLMNTGPFTMSPADSQEVVFAIMHAAAGDAKASVDYLKEVDLLAQLAYDIQFALPASPPTPDVSVTALKDQVLLTWDNSAESYNQVSAVDKMPVPVSFDTTYVTDIQEVVTATQDTTIEGSDTTITTVYDTTYSYVQVVDQIDTTFQGEDTYFRFEGYNVYQHETASGAGESKKIATFDLNNGLTEIYDNVFNSELGATINQIVQGGSDSGIQRMLAVTQDAIGGGIPLKVNRQYYFSVTAYGYNEYGIPKTLESPNNIFSVRPQVPNTWAAGDGTAESGTMVSSTHTDGGSDGTIMVKVIDPTKLTGNTYQVYHNVGHFYRDLNGVWQPTDSDGGVAKSLDCTGSTVTAAAIASATIGSVDLTFTFDMVCGSNWVDGIQLDLPDDLTVNSWPSLGEDRGNNSEGTLSEGNVITWGDSARSTWGGITSGLVWTVNVSPPSSYPVSIGYHIWDDGYDGTIVDASGDAEVTELGFEHKSFLHWNVKNTTTGVDVLEDQTMVSGVSYENVVDGVLHEQSSAMGETANAMFDGLQVMVNGPSNGIHGVWQVSNASGEIAGVDDDVNENILWLNFLTAPGYPTAQANDGYFFFVHGGGTANDLDSFYERVFRGGNFNVAIPYDYEMRFTEEGGKAWMAYTSGTIVDIPFETWNLGTTPNDPSDDVRMINWIFDSNGNDVYDFHGEDAHSSADNDPSTDWVYWRNPTDMTPGTAGYDACVSTPSYGYSEGYYGTEVMARTMLMNWNGYASVGDSLAVSELSSPDSTQWTAADTTLLLERGWFLESANSLGNWTLDTVGGVAYAYGLILEMPEVGTTFRVITNKPNTVDDTFTFTTDGLTGDNDIAYEVGNVNVWPNPYFGYNPEERNPLDQKVQFTHLPDDGTSTKIRIFDLAGQPVKTLTHDGSSQYMEWNLTNNFDVPVASGMYLAHVETHDGQSTILKLGVVQPEQRIDVY